MVVHDINDISSTTNRMFFQCSLMTCTFQQLFAQESTALIPGALTAPGASLLPMVPLLHQRHVVPMAVMAILHSAAALQWLEPRIALGSSHQRESRWWIEPCENWNCYWHSCHEPIVDSKEESCQPSLGFACNICGKEEKMVKQWRNEGALMNKLDSWFKSTYLWDILRTEAWAQQLLAALRLVLQGSYGQNVKTHPNIYHLVDWLFSSLISWGESTTTW